MEVKGSSHRERQAMATKQQVAAAARSLFAANGYVSTTIAAIAETAEIPAPTIYSAFGNKAQILQAVAWGATANLEVDRTHDEALTVEPSVGLRMVAGLQRRQYEQMLDIVTVYQEAAKVDPVIAAGLAQIQGNRERGFTRHIAAIAEHLRPDIDVARGVDIYLTLVLPEIYRTLVIERRWSADNYEGWLGDELIHGLLDRD